MSLKYSKHTLLFFFAWCLFNSTAYCQSQLVRTIYFKPNSYAIDKKYHKTLAIVVKKLNSDTFSYLKIFGYADIKGTDVYNDILSQKRANAVYKYLAGRAKIDTAKVYVTSIGKSGQDVAYDLHFAPAHIQKRCVDIWVTFDESKKSVN